MLQLRVLRELHLEALSSEKLDLNIYIIDWGERAMLSAYIFVYEHNQSYATIDICDVSADNEDRKAGEKRTECERVSERVSEKGRKYFAMMLSRDNVHPINH